MIVNIEQAKELVEGDKDFYLELTETFFQEYDALLKDLHQAVANRDADLLNRTAHTIKGALGNLCASSAKELALQLERCGKGKIFEGTDQLLLDFVQAIAVFREFLNAEIVNGTAW